VDLTDKSVVVDDLDLIPDGALTINTANKEKIKYTLQINDQKYYQYHRNNGVSKIGIVDPNSEFID
jgi:hypothetical protein